MPGGSSLVLTGKIVGMIDREHNKEDKLGRWNSIQIKGENKRIQIITVCRIPESIQKGILKNRT